MTRIRRLRPPRAKYGSAAAFLLLLQLALFGAGCISTGEGADEWFIVERPEWKPGYSWVFADAQGGSRLALDVVAEGEYRGEDVYFLRWQQMQDGDQQPDALRPVALEDWGAHAGNVHGFEASTTTSPYSFWPQETGESLLVTSFLRFPLEHRSDLEWTERVSERHSDQPLYGGRVHVMKETRLRGPIAIESPFLGKVDTIEVILDYSVSNADDAARMNATHASEPLGLDPWHLSLQLNVSPDFGTIVRAVASGGINASLAHSFGSFLFHEGIPREYWLVSAHLEEGPPMASDDMVRQWGSSSSPNSESQPTIEIRPVATTIGEHGGNIQFGGLAASMNTRFRPYLEYHLFDETGAVVTNGTLHGTLFLDRSLSGDVPVEFSLRVERAGGYNLAYAAFYYPEVPGPSERFGVGVVPIQVDAVFEVTIDCWMTVYPVQRCEDLWFETGNLSSLDIGFTLLNGTGLGGLVHVTATPGESVLEEEFDGNTWQGAIDDSKLRPGDWMVAVEPKANLVGGIAYEIQALGARPPTAEDSLP